MKLEHQPEKPSYKEKTDRIHAWGNLGGLLIKMVWAVVIVIILASLGKLLLVNDPKNQESYNDSPKEKPIIAPVAWHEVDKSIVEALKLSRKTAEELASSKLDVWVNKQMVRVDNDFLEWYFGYWNQQVMEISALWYGAEHWIDGDKPTSSEKVTEKVQEEFSKRVLRPQIAQLELERMTRDVVNQYAVSLRNNLKKIPQKYNIPQKDWNRHLDDIAILTNDVEGNRKVDVSLKAITTSIAAGTIVLAKAMAPAMKAVGTKVSANLAGKAAAKMAAKTGGKVAAKAGGKIFGPIVGIGIIIWDVWDHNSTVNENKPILRKGIQDYFYEVKDMLLHDTESSVMSVIYIIEGNVLNTI